MLGTVHIVAELWLCWEKCVMSSDVKIEKRIGSVNIYESSKESLAVVSLSIQFNGKQGGLGASQTKGFQRQPCERDIRRQGRNNQQTSQQNWGSSPRNQNRPIPKLQTSWSPGREMQVYKAIHTAMHPRITHPHNEPNEPTYKGFTQKIANGTT